MVKVDIIIPVYKPDQSFFTLIDKLEQQTVPVNKIILMNTEQKYIERLVYGTSFLEKHRNIVIKNLSKREFNHGGTRNSGVKRSEAEIFVMMTQDAVPADRRLLEHLLQPLEQEKVAVSYARQLPAKDCGTVEKYTREFNYPPESRIKSKKDLPELGIKTYFCSNVCAAYKREIFDKVGGFTKYTIFNEDMIYAANAVQAGYSIAYAADARVVHSHNYTCMQQLHRNFDLGVSQADHPEVFASVPSEKEGVALLRRATAHLWRKGTKRYIPMLYVNSTFRYAGFFLGSHYRRLPMAFVMKCTMNRDYWEQEKRIKSSAGIDAARGYGKTEEEDRGF